MESSLILVEQAHIEEVALAGVISVDDFVLLCVGDCCAPSNGGHAVWVSQVLAEERHVPKHMEECAEFIRYVLFGRG